MTEANRGPFFFRVRYSIVAKADPSRVLVAEVTSHIAYVKSAEAAIREVRRNICACTKNAAVANPERLGVTPVYAIEPMTIHVRAVEQITEREHHQLLVDAIGRLEAREREKDAQRLSAIEDGHPITIH